MRKLLWTIVVLVLAGTAAYVSLSRYRSRNVGAVQRGYRIADETGCFTCHGPGGHRGMLDPGHGLEDVPPWSGGILATYAENEEEIRQWIVNGLPESVRKDPEQMKLRERAVVRMPAFRAILGDAQVSDLVAYVKAVGDLEKPKDARRRGGTAGRPEATAASTAMGPRGGARLPNARSLKGYIPAWDGADFPELAADDQEIRDWILDGGTRAVLSSRMAQLLPRAPADQDAGLSRIRQRRRRPRACRLHPLGPATPLLRGADRSQRDVPVGVQDLEAPLLLLLVLLLVGVELPRSSSSSSPGTPWNAAQFGEGDDHEEGPVGAAVAVVRGLEDLDALDPA